MGRIFDPLPPRYQFVVPVIGCEQYIETGDNFSGVGRSAENAGILLANPLRPYFYAPKSLCLDELTLPTSLMGVSWRVGSCALLGSPTVSAGFLY